MSRIARRRVARVPRRRVLLGRIGDVDQVMRDAALLGERHLVGADVEAAVDRGRIAVDDLAAEAAGQRDAERALAGRGRAEDRDEPRRAHGRERRATHARTNTSTTSAASSDQQPELLRPRTASVIGAPAVSL